MSWKQINSNSNVLRKVEEIAIAIYNLEPKNLNFSLFGGFSGIILFLNYFYSLTGENKYKEKGDLLLELCFSKLSNQSLTLSSGLAGIGWTLEHLEQNGFIHVDTNELLEELDELLFEKLTNDLLDGNIDYLHGGLGYVFYFLKRYNKTKNIFKNEFIIDRIAQLAIKGDDLKWVNNFNAKEDGGIDMGLAHGMASVMVIMSKFFALDPTNLKLKTLIADSFKFYANNKLPIECLSIYPYQSNDIKQKRPSRLAWCYGDLGIASSLYLSSKSIANDQMLCDSLNIFRHASERRGLVENIVMDAGICHGSAGIAHIFNRIYQETNDEKFKETANYWVEQTLKMSSFSDGIAGLKTWKNERKVWVNSYDLLDGVAGIGLALISVASSVEPKWDECFLLS